MKGIIWEQGSNMAVQLDYAHFRPKWMSKYKNYYGKGSNILNELLLWGNGSDQYFSKI